MEIVEHAALQQLFQVSSFIYNGRSETNLKRGGKKITLCSLYNFNPIRSCVKTLVDLVLLWKVYKNISEGILITLPAAIKTLLS